jgi:hypothetical protein
MAVGEISYENIAMPLTILKQKFSAQEAAL